MDDNWLDIVLFNVTVFLYFLYEEDFERYSKEYWRFVLYFSISL